MKSNLEQQLTKVEEDIKKLKEGCFKQIEMGDNIYFCGQRYRFSDFKHPTMYCKECELKMAHKEGEKETYLLIINFYGEKKE